jgi:uncharacterized protein YqjF (DUF2071 family)
VTDSSRGQPFLTAEWRDLVMLNYPIERELLEPLAPAGTIVDTYRGVAYVSVVGFLFQRTKVLGIPVLFHQSFEEVNLRFYVRRFAGDEWRRGVVFIKEIVPTFLVSNTARFFYNENYITCAMRHRTENQGETRMLEYAWEYGGEWHRMSAQAVTPAKPALAGSLEEFISDHQWGYTRQRDGSTLEYEVLHPKWDVAPAQSPQLKCDVVGLYGSRFSPALLAQPSSAFVIPGSAVSVYRGNVVAGPG